MAGTIFSKSVPAINQPFYLFSPLKMNSNGRKRQAPPLQQPQLKHQTAIEEEDVDEDVFLEETLLQYEEDAQALRDVEERQALASRLQRWKRPQLSQAYLSESQSISMLKNLEFLTGIFVVHFNFFC